MPPAATDTTRLLSREELAAWAGFLRAHAAVTRELDAELSAAHDLPLSSYEVLLYLHSAPEGMMRMSELADTVLLSRSGLTRLVDRLERTGLLERRQCSSDARGYHAAITAAGRRAFRDARATHLAGVRERFLRHLSAEELRRLAAVWDRIEPGAVS
jgi:DNA-binding MarR family transcriptional regulator